MIDLHTHTTASDGRCTPAELVERASAAGVRVLAVTDHDTLGGCEAASRACGAAGIEFVPGIEITAALDGVDVHVLGYFVETTSAPLAAFLDEQRRRRLDRIRQIGARLRELGMPLDVEAILGPAAADPARSVGRPAIARAMVAARYVASTGAAFDRWLARGRPAYVPRLAAPPSEVFARIHEAGGLASLAHPRLIGRDEWIPRFADAGLDALEAYHVDHHPLDTSRYLTFAERLDLAVTGGTDYHADSSHGGSGPGTVSLPREHYDRLRARARR